MRTIAAELDWDEEGGLAVLRLTDENGNDATWLVGAGRRFAAIGDLEAALATELGVPVAVEEG